VSTLTLFVPGLLCRPDAALGLTATDVPRCPALEIVLARGECTPHRGAAHASHEAALCALFGLDQDENYDLPIAALTRLADCDDTESGVWARADPVHLRADLGKLRLLFLQDLPLDQATALGLCEELNAHLSADDLQLSIGRDPSRWYLKIPGSVPRLRSVPPALALGQHIDPYVPRGADTSNWMRLANEIQMLLHDSPINAEREARGQPTVNSLWFWGFGSLPNIVTSRWQVIWSDDPLARGLGMASHQHVTTLPETIDRALQSIDAGTHILALPREVEATFLHKGLVAWLPHLQDLEDRWLAPSLRRLKAGQLQALTLVTEQASYNLNRRHLYRLWQRPRPLTDHLT
jgi:hypothetical protein